MAARKVGRYLSPQAKAQFDAVYDKAMRSLPEPAETHDIPTGFGRVRVYGFGEGGDPRRPIVLLHGRTATSVMWRTNLPTFTRDRRVYTVDLLGEAGRSTQTAPITSAADQAAWLDQTLEGLGVSAAHLVGVSIGGWLAGNQAVRAPEKVASVSLIEPVNTLARIPVAMIFRTLPTVIPGISRWGRPWFMKWIDGQDAELADVPEAEVIDAAMAYYRVALPAPAYLTDDQLRGITVPTLTLVAGRSVVHDAQRAHARALALIPGVTAELWSEATHSIAGQFAERVSERVLRFVDER